MTRLYILSKDPVSRIFGEEHKHTSRKSGHDILATGSIAGPVLVFGITASVVFGVILFLLGMWM